MRFRIGLLALLALAGPAWAGKPTPPPAAPPVSGPPAAPPVKPEQEAAAFKPYDDAIASGQKTAAADALLPVLDDPALLAIHGKAWAKLGDLLVSFDMKYSGLLAFVNAIEADPTGVGPTKVKQALALAEEMGDARALGPVLAKNLGLSTEPETRSKVAFYAARQLYQDGSPGQAATALMLVDKASTVFAKAEQLRGVMLAEQGKETDALVPFLAAASKRDQVQDPDRFENILALNMGRAYYAANNYPRAIEYFARVERGSEFWVESQFERAWAHFRLDDMNGTLGLLESLHTPFLDDWYYPEGDLLRVYSFFLLCKFPTAGTEIDAFSAKYKPLRQELDKTLGAMTPKDAWDDGRALLEKRPTKLPTSLIRTYRWEDRLEGAVKSVQKAEEELGRLRGSAANPFTERAIKLLQGRRDQIAQAEGARILGTAIRKRDELADMLSNVEITKLDIMQYETRLLEAAAAGKPPKPPSNKDLRKVKRTKGTQSWAFEGEYWADEVGYYRYQAKPDCPTGLVESGGR